MWLVIYSINITNIDTKYRIMSSARFHRLVSDAYINNDISGIREAAHDFLVSHCLHPSKLQIYDAHTQMPRVITIACGKCAHCAVSKVNEWCTRMYAHAEDFKNIYFVTLTYRSLTDVSRPVNQLLLDKLSQAVWHRDAFNATRHYSYNPCLLVKKHYQDFLKRLRKSTGLNDITYVMSGEYGSRYGRPHFHLVLFTNGSITRQQVQRAWSICLWRTNKGDWTYRRNQKHDGVAYDFPIGRVDFHDLVSNGTFNTTAKIRVDGTFMNAANCFAYVCKYVVKRDHANLSRVNLAYRSLFHKEEFCKIYDNEVSYNKAFDWCLEHNFSAQQADTISNNLKSFTYEKIIYQPSVHVYTSTLKRSEKFTLFGYPAIREFFPSLYLDFRDSFVPFCEFSRGCPIGSLYAKRNILEFTQDVYSKPILQTSGFVVPNYFRRKAQEHIYGLREVRTTISSTSFALSGLVDLQRRFEGSSQDLCTQIDFTRCCFPFKDFEKAISLRGKTFVDLNTRERIKCGRLYMHYYKYDRKQRKMIPTRTMSVPDFIRYWSSRLLEEYNRYSVQRARSLENMRHTEAAFLIATDLGEEEKSLRERFEKQQAAERKERNLLYDSLHTSVE